MEAKQISSQIEGTIAPILCQIIVIIIIPKGNVEENFFKKIMELLKDVSF